MPVIVVTWLFGLASFLRCAARFSWVLKCSILFNWVSFCWVGWAYRTEGRDKAKVVYLKALEQASQGDGTGKAYPS